VTHREHDHDLLGAYALGVLDPDEAHTVDAHLASCTGCRRELTGLAAMRSSLAGVPAEAFLDGPPEGGDLLLRRTLRAVRDDNARTRRHRITLFAAGLIVLATVAADRRDHQDDGDAGGRLGTGTRRCPRNQGRQAVPAHGRRTRRRAGRRR
jgi:anti-sigma factor RsiW